MNFETKDIVFRNINILIKHKGIKKSDFEKSIGVSVGFLSRKGNISLSVLEKIALVLEIDTTQLFDKDLYKQDLMSEVTEFLEKKYVNQEGFEPVEFWEYIYDLSLKRLNFLSGGNHEK